MRILTLAEPGASSRLSRPIGQATQWISAALFIALLVVNLVQVSLRAAGGGFVWVTDLSQVMLLWMVMTGVVAAYCLGEHIVTGYLDTKLSGRPQVVLLLGLRVLEVLFFLVLVIAGYTVTTVRAAIPYVQLGISTGWTYAAIPVAGLLLLAAAVSRPLSLPSPEVPLDDLPEGQP
jgi:TRAP-type C4-dicarboxylate transport system permease small subunit